MADCFMWKNWVSFTNGLVKEGGIWQAAWALWPPKMAPPIARVYYVMGEGTKDNNFLGK